MKFEINWANVRKLCLNILMRLQYEQPKLEGQRSTLTFGPYLLPLSNKVKHIK